MNRALRIGTNHGSLCDRIMNRYGDTPLGMVESALEFARICRKHDFHNFKFSMKSSNPKVMIECYRLLVARLEQEGPDWNYPIHLGVTEAGEGEDGRIKIRHRHRLPALRRPRRHHPRLAHGRFAARNRSLPRFAGADSHCFPNSDFRIPNFRTSPFDPFHFARRETPEIELADGVKCGGEQLIRVVVTRATWDKVAPKIRPKDDVKPEAVYEDLNVAEIDPTQDFEINCETQLVTVKDGLQLPAITAFRLLAAKLKRLGRNNPILLKDCLVGVQPSACPDKLKLELHSNPRLPCSAPPSSSARCWRTALATRFWFAARPARGQSLRLAYNILQAAGCR